MASMMDSGVRNANDAPRTSGPMVDVLRTAMIWGRHGLQDFFLSYIRMSSTERLLLARRRLDHLANGTFPWLLFQLVSAAAVWRWGAETDHLSIALLGTSV